MKSYVKKLCLLNLVALYFCYTLLQSGLITPPVKKTAKKTAHAKLAPQPAYATTVPSLAPKTESFAPVRSTEVFIASAVNVPQAKLVFTVGPLKGQEFSVKGNLHSDAIKRAHLMIPETQVSGQHL